MEQLKRGVFYGVGVGPGDPELMTLKAVRTIERCAVIATPRTRDGEMLALRIAGGAADLSGKTVLPLDFTMERDKDKQRAAHERAAEQVEAYLSAGQDVVMLNLGDVSIYATWSYLMELLRGRGYETAMVPGIPSFCAIAARLGVSLTEMNSQLHIAPGGVSAAEAIGLSGTKVLMKSGRQLPDVLNTLEENGLLEKSMLVKSCGLPDEEIFPNLSQSRPTTDLGYFATVIVKE